MGRRRFSPEFKLEAASLVLDRGYSIRQACDTTGTGRTAMQRWVEQLRHERNGKTPANSKALTPEQQRIQALEAKVWRLERDKEILKKATALLMSGEFD
jgi:transposase